MQEFANQYTGQVLPNRELRQYDPAMDQQVAGFDPAQAAALRGIHDVAGGQGADYATLMQQVQDSAGGKYLSPETNPYLQATYDLAARGVTDQYQNSTAPGITADALRAGAFGGSAQAELQNQARYGLGQNLSELGTQIYGGNYQQERQNQLASQQAMPGLLEAQYNPYHQMFAAGGAQQGQAQNAMDAATANARGRDEYSFNILDRLGGAYQTALGPEASQFTVGTKRGGNLSSVMGK